MSPSCSVGTSWVAHVGLEDRPVDRRVDDPRRGSASQRSPATKVWSLPMAKGSLRAKALAPAAASARAGHLRVGSRFVDEDQPMGLGPHLGLSFSLPHRARLAHVGPIAFTGLKAFFKAQAVADQPARQRGGVGFHSAGGLEFAGQLRHADVVLLRHPAQDEDAVRIGLAVSPAAERLAGATAPRSPKAVIKLITNEGDTLKWAAAARRECPASPSLTTRSPRSSE